MYWGAESYIWFQVRKVGILRLSHPLLSQFLSIFSIQSDFAAFHTFLPYNLQKGGGQQSAVS